MLPPRHKADDILWLRLWVNHIAEPGGEVRNLAARFLLGSHRGTGDDGTQYLLVLTPGWLWKTLKQMIQAGAAAAFRAVLAVQLGSLPGMSAGAAPPDGMRPIGRTCAVREILVFPHPMLVFIDESGDPGFKLGKGSAPIFVAAMVVFHDHGQALATQTAIEDAAVKLRIHPEFKFSRCRDEIRDAFFETVRPFDFRVRAIVVQKDLIYSQHLRSEKERFYSFFVKSMLKFDDGLLEGAHILIDGSGDREFRRQLEAYLRRHLGRGKVKKIRFRDSHSDPLIQLADMCAGAIARANRPDRDDQYRWMKMFRPKIDDIWRFG